MNVTPMQRTIVEYAMTISGEDAKLCLDDPLAEGQRVREQLVAHMPGVALVEAAAITKAGSNGTVRKTTRKTTPARTTAGKAAGARPNQELAPGKNPKAQLRCPHCPKVFKQHKRLETHVRKMHPGQAIPPRP